MLILIIGGAASGKSELAEGICVRLSKSRKAYIATMAVCDDESAGRVAKHREMRKDKGFSTVEHSMCGQYRRSEFSGCDTALLECVSNLLANEMYMAGESACAAETKIAEYVGRLAEDVKHAVIVSNDIFAAAGDYDAFTREYISALGNINRRLAETADEVIESVCGIPVYLKGRLSSVGPV